MLLLVIGLILSCSEIKKKANKPTFLIGNWKRLNDKPGNQTFELWKPNFEGLGYTLKDGKTTFSEQLKIVVVNDTLHLQVTGVNEKPTLFKFKNQTDTSFIAVNPENEFPKTIKYVLDKGKLKAEVSNDDFRIDFLFKKTSD